MYYVFLKNDIICIRGEMAQSLFGSFILYIYIYIYNFLYCFSERFLLAEYFVTVFQSVLDQLG